MVADFGFRARPITTSRFGSQCPEVLWRRHLAGGIAFARACEKSPARCQRYQKPGHFRKEISSRAKVVARSFY
jgi:hypothetical protein